MLRPRGSVVLLVLAGSTVLGTVTAALPWTAEDIFGVFLFALVSLSFGLALLRVRPGCRTGLSVLALAFVLRGVGAIVQRLWSLPSLYTIDAQAYDHAAWTIAQAWLVDGNAVIPPRSFQVSVYEALVAGVYLVVGRSVLTLQVLSALVGALAVYYTWRSAQELLGETPARLMGLWFAVWPSHIVWTSQSLRDPWVLFFLSRAVYSGILWLKYRQSREWIKAVCFVGVLGAVRLSTAVVMSVALITMSVYVAWWQSTRRSRLALFVVATAEVLLIWWAETDGGTIGSVATWLLAKLSGLRRGLASGGSAFSPAIRYDSWTDVLAYLPFGMAYVLFAPFPWDAENVAQLVSGLENVLVLALVAIGILMFRRGTVFRHRWGAFAGLVVFLGIGILALVEGNLGTAFRHKAQYLPYLFLLIFSGWPTSRRPAGSTYGPSGGPPSQTDRPAAW